MIFNNLYQQLKTMNYIYLILFTNLKYTFPISSFSDTCGNINIKKELILDSIQSKEFKNLIISFLLLIG